MVHRVYICSNLKSPFVVQQYDNFEAYNIYNQVMSRSPSFVIKQHVKFQEGEQYWLLPTICPPTKLKPRTNCCQEGKDDEDMTPSDTTIDYKVQFTWFHMYMSLFEYMYKCVSKCKSIKVELSVRRQPDSASLEKP
jgi:hypothetical protein